MLEKHDLILASPGEIKREGFHLIYINRRAFWKKDNAIIHGTSKPSAPIEVVESKIRN